MDEIKGIKSHAGIAYVLTHVSLVMRQGIGVSRRDVQKQNGGETPFAHSWGLFHRYMGIAKEFVGYCKQEGANRLDKTRYEHVEKFLMEKAAKGRSQSTLKISMAALEKVFWIVGRMDIKEQIATNYSAIKAQGRPGHSTHAFSNPSALIEKISQKSPSSGIIAELQRLTGAKIGEVKKLSCDQDAKTIYIRGKGGRERTLDFADRTDKLARIGELQKALKGQIKEHGWGNLRKSYYEDVKNSCSSLREEYYGAHGFRAVYAQELADKLRGEGMEKEEIERNVTEELGHSRRSMARHYLSC